MEESILVPLLMAFTTVVILLVAFLAKKEGKSEGYKQGQIDFKNGIIKIRFIQFKDGERKYYMEDELKDLEEHTLIE